jgi:predicted acyltransferase
MEKQILRISNEQVTKRLVSIDALRGFDMFWIMGGDFLFRSFRQIYDCPFTKEMEIQMEHVQYEGFHFYDFIFPLFLFIVGISISLSLPRTIEREGKTTALKHIALRSLILFLLGVFYMGGIANGVDNIYLVGVLQRISVAYFFSAILFCFFGNRGMAIIIVLLLIGYYMLLAFVPVPGYGEPSFEQGRNLAHYIDQWLPGQKFEGTILSTLGAVANVLIGILIGKLLRIKDISNQRKVIMLFICGFICLLTGYFFGIWFPIIKAIWTSSYVLVACGYGMILLAIFYQLIEVWEFQIWARPFVWIGMNSITIYIASALLNFRKLSLRFVGGEVGDFLGNYCELMTSLITLLFVFWLAGFLYKNKIFIRS